MEDKGLLVILCTLAAVVGCTSKTVSVGELTTEMRVCPTIEVGHSPRLSWKVFSNENGTTPKAYQIIVRDEDGRTVWNTHKVHSEGGVMVPYEGETLQAETDYNWKVRVWTDRGRTEWSAPAIWSVGLADSTSWAGAEWIGINEREKLRQDENHLSARYLRKEFTLKDHTIKKAKLYMCALGMGDAEVNGHRVSRDIFAHPPVLFIKRIMYRTYDVTDLVQAGDNVMTVLLGNGRWQTLKCWSLRGVEDPRVKLALKVTYEGGEQDVVVSDTSWMGTSQGPITDNNEMDGEYYDARLEMPGWDQKDYAYTSVWQQVDTLYEPKGEMHPMPMDDMAVQDTVVGQSVRALPDGSYLIDMGQNMVGRAEMTLCGRAGEPVVIKYAENLLPGGTGVDQSNLRAALGTDQYTPSSDGEFTYCSTFPYHGFRYAQIWGVTAEPDPSKFKGLVVYDEMPTDGEWTSSSEQLNQLYHNMYWCLRSCYRGMPIDCPQRDERQGWLGDRGATILGEPYMFGVGPLYRKWMDDVYDSMSKKGRISVVSPRNWTIYNDDTYASIVFLYMADMLYTRYGDDSGITTYYDTMKMWLDYITTKNLHDGIFHMKYDEYADWCVAPSDPPVIHTQEPERLTESDLIQTGIYTDVLREMIKFAQYTGNVEDIPAYQATLAEVGEAFNERFFNSEQSCYDNNTMTSSLIALRFDLVPEGRRQDVVNTLVSKIRDCDNHLIVGNVGVRYAMQTLTEAGEINLAYELAMQDTYPSWGYMLSRGATSIWELWNGDTADAAMNSGSHAHLIGDLLSWYYENLAGIKNDPTDVAFHKIILQPSFPQGLDSVAASFDSPYGLIRSAWSLDYDDDYLVWDVTVPVGSTATAIVPALFNVEVENAGDSIKSEIEGEFTKISLSSGSYRLSTRVD